MKKIMCLLIVLVGFVLASCDEVVETTKKDDPEIVEKQISFTASEMYLNVDEIVPFDIIKENIDSLDEIIVSSSNDEIAMIIDGEIIGVGAGEATISAVLKTDNQVTATMLVIVDDYSNEYFSFYRDVKEVIEATTTPLGLDYKNGYDISKINIEVSDPEVVKVENESIIALKKGSTTIICSSKENPNLKAKLTVNVKYVTPEVTAPTSSLLVGQKTKLVVSNLSLVHATTNSDFSFSSLDESIATVDDSGVVTATGVGSVAIQVANKNIPEISCEFVIDVYTKETNIIVLTASNVDAFVKAGEYLQILGNHEASLYDWSSANTNIASVDSNGRVLGFNTGTTNIIASLKTDSKVKGAIRVTVEGTYKINYLEQFINIALGEVGTVEGYGNITKYGEWYGMNGEPWCAMYVSWCANQAGIAKEIIPHYAAVTYFMDWYVQRESFGYKESYVPKCGDLIIFKSNGASHIGIVLGVKDGTVYTVEGNTSNMCARRNYPLNYANITGYGIPKWPDGCTAPNINLDGSTSGGGASTN